MKSVDLRTRRRVLTALAAILLTAIGPAAWAFDLDTHRAAAATAGGGYSPGKGLPRRTRFGRRALDLMIRYSTIGDLVQWTWERSQTHFDNCYWDEGEAWIADNRRAAVRHARRYFLRRDPRELTRVFEHLGFVIHAAEDFYAHSNWVETHPSGTIADLEGPRPPGWYSGTYPNPGDTGPRRGAAHCPPGTPTHAQMSKDSPGRPGYDEAFWDAVEAVYQQINLFQAALIQRYPNDAPAMWKDLGFQSRQSAPAAR